MALYKTAPTSASVRKHRNINNPDISQRKEKINEIITALYTVYHILSYMLKRFRLIILILIANLHYEDNVASKWGVFRANRYLIIKWI